jgi:hypothetical protein
MKRRLAVLAVSVCALVAMFAVSAPSASAAYVQGCVHWNEHHGPYGAFVIDAYNRCNGVTIRRKPNVINGPDGECKRMIPNHHYQWQLWPVPQRPFGPSVRGWDWC